MAEQGASADTQEKKESLPLLVNQEGYRYLVRSCREKTRKAKAQLELNLTTVVRENKKCFYKYINNKKRAKEISIIYWMWDGGGEHCHQG